MPPRSLTGTLFGAAAALWGLLVGVLIALLAPEGSGPSGGFWVGLVLVIASGAGVGATGGHRLARTLPQQGRADGVIRAAGGGIALLLGAGVAAAAAGGLLAVLTTGANAAWSALRQAWLRPDALAGPVAAVLLIGVPLGAAAGMVLRALTTSPGSTPADGSPRRPLR